MKLYLILTVLLTVGIILLCGCVNVNVGKDNEVMTTPTVIPQKIDNTISTTPTINENLWIPIIDSTYVLTANCGLDQANIPIVPNSAYRLNVKGTKPLWIVIYSSMQGENCDSQGKQTSFATLEQKDTAWRVTNYNGIFKTNYQQKILHIE